MTKMQHGSGQTDKHQIRRGDEGSPRYRCQPHTEMAFRRSNMKHDLPDTLRTLDCEDTTAPASSKFKIELTSPLFQTLMARGVSPSQSVMIRRMGQFSYIFLISSASRHISFGVYVVANRNRFSPTTSVTHQLRPSNTLNLPNNFGKFQRFERFGTLDKNFGIILGIKGDEATTLHVIGIYDTCNYM